MGYTFRRMMASFCKEAVMPWKALSMYEQRMAMIQRIVTLKQPVGQVAKEFGLSRKTVHKWLRRYRQEKSLSDQSRRPRHSPGRTSHQVEEAVLDLRERLNWGPRKIHRILSDLCNAGVERARAPAAPAPPVQQDAACLSAAAACSACAPVSSAMPCLRTVARILSRNDCVGPPAKAPPPALQCFERSTPNALWQLDHKG